MGPIEITDLKAKIDVLCAMSTLRTVSALAKAFDISESGVRYWTDGDASRPPGLLPAMRYLELLALLQKHLPGDRTEEETKRLLHGPLGAFRQAFLTGADGNWGAFLARRADKAGLMLEIRPAAATPRRGPAELDLPPDPLIGTIAPGDQFRLRFETGFRTTAPFWSVLLQSQDGLWDALPFAPDETIAEIRGKRVDGPSPLDDAQGWYRVKPTAYGPLCFVGLALADPLPDELRSAIASGQNVDGARLDALAYHLSRRDERGVRVVSAERRAPENGTSG